MVEGHVIRLELSEGLHDQYRMQEKSTASAEVRRRWGYGSSSAACLQRSAPLLVCILAYSAISITLRGHT